MNSERYKTMVCALAAGTTVTKKALKWGCWFFNMILPCAQGTLPDYGAKLEDPNPSGGGKSQSTVTSYPNYILSASGLIAFLIYKERLVLPTFPGPQRLAPSSIRSPFLF